MPPVLVLRQPALPKLPEDFPDPSLHYQRMKVNSKGEEADVLVAYDRYKIWKPAADYRVRWAEISWPDDGFGIYSHGAAPTILGALRSCYEHKTLREATAAEL